MCGAAISPPKQWPTVLITITMYYALMFSEVNPPMFLKQNNKKQNKMNPSPPKKKHICPKTGVPFHFILSKAFCVSMNVFPRTLRGITVNLRVIYFLFSTC